MVYSAIAARRAGPRIKICLCATKVGLLHPLGMMAAQASEYLFGWPAARIALLGVVARDPYYP